MLKKAAERCFQPELVDFDSWYSGLETLIQVHDLEWTWLTQLKANRLVDPQNSGNLPISPVVTPITGLVVHLKGYGFIKVFKIAAPNGSIEYWATSNLKMTTEQLAERALQSWQIEEYHRAIKQFCGIEWAQHRLAIAQRNHIGLALCAFLRLEYHRLQTGVSWFETKKSIIREAVRAYLANPRYFLGGSTV